MEEKKFQRHNSSFWSFSNIGNYYQSFLGRRNLSPRLAPSGFTLVELLVVVIIISILIGIIFVTLNPIKQIQKSQDAQREHDLKQINNALEAYYNDNNCYPEELSQLSEAAIYIKSIPKDPAVSFGWQNYVYETDGSSCPQWNVLYAKLTATSSSTISCPLNQMQSCLPPNAGGYNYCILSGNVDCSIVSSFDGLKVASFVPTGSTPTPTVVSGPAWKILVLIYKNTDFSFTDSSGVARRVVASLTEDQMNLVTTNARNFVEEDIPLLNSGYMRPSVTIRYPERTLTAFEPWSNGYWPSRVNTAPERDSAFDSVIVVWAGDGVDVLHGNSTYTLVSACGLTTPNTDQLYSAIPASCVNPYDRNVFKHEWAHGIVFYYDYTGAAPKPAVNVDINYPPDDQYGHCGTGTGYDFVRWGTGDTLANPKPNSIENNLEGFLHDIYSGTTALKTAPTVCLGVPQSAWETGGPVSH